jgi:Transcriptional regulator/sugar kinase
MLVIGADIGGSHITAAQVDLEHKQMVEASLHRCHVNSLAQPQQVMDEWAACIKKAAGNSPISILCLAMPGPFDYEEGICLIQDQSKYPKLYGMNVKKPLAELLGIKPDDIHINNDAACFLQGETFCGSVQDYNRVIGVTLGTGLGSAIYENGRARSADLWKMPFKESMAENYLSTRWFLQRHAGVSGVRELAQMAPNNEQVHALFAEFGQNLAQFLNTFIKNTAAEAVVIGGNIAQAFPLFKQDLFNHIQHDVLISPSQLGEQSALMGAASFFLLKSVQQ